MSFFEELVNFLEEIFEPKEKKNKKSYTSNYRAERTTRRKKYEYENEYGDYRERKYNRDYYDDIDTYSIKKLNSEVYELKEELQYWKNQYEDVVRQYNKSAEEYEKLKEYIEEMEKKETSMDEKKYISPLKKRTEPKIEQHEERREILSVSSDIVDLYNEYINKREEMPPKFKEINHRVASDRLEPSEGGQAMFYYAEDSGKEYVFPSKIGKKYPHNLSGVYELSGNGRRITVYEACEVRKLNREIVIEKIGKAVLE